MRFYASFYKPGWILCKNIRAEIISVENGRTDPVGSRPIGGFSIFGRVINGPEVK